MDTSTSGSTTKGWRAFARKDWFAFDRVDYLGAKLTLGMAVVGSILFGLVGEAFRRAVVLRADVEALV